MQELSKFRKGKIVLQIIESLNELSNKSHLTIEPEWHGKDDIFKKIAERTGIQFRDRCEAGVVPINENISCTFDELDHNLRRRLAKIEERQSFHRPHSFPEIEVSESLKAKTEAFEKANIPPSGPCKTRIGEIFRAIQRIQYRAHNDGDLPWLVNSPTFMSYMFLVSEADRLNYSSAAYDNVSGNYGFTFSDPTISKISYDGRLFIECEDLLCRDLDITKYQLIDLMEQGVLKDSSNEWDSRDYRLLRSDY